MATMTADVIQLLFRALDTTTNQPPVRLNLGLAGPSGPDASGNQAGASLAFQVGPLPSQAWQQVLMLGQIDLQTAFPRPSSLPEDVKDQRCAVDDLGLLAQCLLQISLLCGRELIVADNGIDIPNCEPILDLLELAGAQIYGRGLGDPLGYRVHYVGARAFGKLPKLIERVPQAPSTLLTAGTDADK